MRDYKKVQKDAPSGISAVPEDSDLMVWDAVMFGPDGTSWEGGMPATFAHTHTTHTHTSLSLCATIRCKKKVKKKNATTLNKCTHTHTHAPQAPSS